MAIHILLEKISETDDSVTYKFDFSVSKFTDSTYGIIQFDKSGENYKIIKELDGDEDHEIAVRALWAILREWRKGIFPDITDWAA